MSYKYLTNFENQIKQKLIELETLTAKLQLLQTSIEDCKAEVEKIHDVIRGLESEKEKAKKIFSSL